MIIDRIKQFIDKKGISISAFEKSVGMSNASFAKSLKSGGAIGTDKLENILYTYPDLSPVWLLTGEGDMLRTADTAPANAIVQAPVPPQFDALISKITQQAEEIGRLKARIAELERRRGDNAPDAQSDNVAHAG